MDTECHEPKGKSIGINANAVLDSLRKCLSDRGYEIPDPRFDSRYHRFQVPQNKNGNKDGVYVLHSDGIPAGRFWNHKTGETFPWSMKRESEMTETERNVYMEQMKAAQAEHDRQQQMEYEKAAGKAAGIWESSTPAADHPYLKKKGVQPHGLKVYKDGRLVVPMTGEDGNIQSVQFISDDGSKRYLYGGKKTGGFFCIPGGKDTICICEGYATGASIYEETSATVYVAFDAGNLKTVSKMVRNRHPSSRIIVCCDNDQWTDGNPGLNKGRDAAESIGADIAVPIFKDTTNRPTDFNDLAAIEGKEVVRQQIIMGANTNRPTQQRKPLISPADLASFSAKRFLSVTPPPIDWLFHDSFIAGTVGLIAANSGVGKSFFILYMAISIVLKSSMFDGIFRADRSGSVVILAGEDSEELIHHRLFTIVETMFPPDQFLEAYTSAVKALSEKLFIIPIAGQDFRMTKKTRENLEASPAYEDLLETLKTIPDLALVVLDPFSRFYSESEIDPTQQTFFISLMERITIDVKSKPAVIISAHTHKAAGLTRGRAGLSQEMIRGATGLTAGARWQLGLVLMSDDEIRKAGGDLNHPYNYLWGKVVKKNAGPPEQAFALERGAGGTFKPIEISEDNEAVRDEETLIEISNKLSELEEMGEYKTIKNFSEDYAGIFPGYGRRRLRALLENAVKDGLLFIVGKKSKNGNVRNYLSATDF